MRLILIWQADLLGQYCWVPPPVRGELLISFDLLAAQDLDSRSPVQFDELLSWEERSEAEHQVSTLIAKVRGSAAGSYNAIDGYGLVDFVEYRLRSEFAGVLRGWAAGSVAGTRRELVADPATPSAVVLGARAAMGLDVKGFDYRPSAPSCVPDVARRFVARALMKAVDVASNPNRVRIAAVMAAKVVPAIEAVDRKQLLALGVGAAPFLGLDYGNSARIAVRRRLPFISALEPRRRQPSGSPQYGRVAFRSVDRALGDALNRATRGLFEAAWPQLAATVASTRGLERSSSLRAVLLPTSAVGASRVLGDWARRRSIAVAVVQHGIYGFKEADGGDGRADVLFTWGEGVELQAAHWPAPRPRLVPIGVPGLEREPPRAVRSSVRNVLFVTTGRPIDSALAEAAFHEWFVAAVAPGVRCLLKSGVDVAFRLHPDESDQIYSRLLLPVDENIKIASRESVADAVRNADLLVCAPSSIAVEAAALGAPVLLWLGGTPSAIRREHLVPPLSESLPGTFNDESEFSGLAAALVQDGAPTLTTARELSRHLTSYAQPFDVERFAIGLEELGN